MQLFYIILFLILLYYILLYNNIINENFVDNDNNKYVCLYAYYEKNNQYKENLEFFLNNGGILNNINYYIIINGNCTIDIPKKNNIKVIIRPNIGYDFGAWAHVLNNHINKNYEYYIFINSSVRGPYVNINSNTNWLDKFMLLFNTEDVKMVGTTINILESDISYFKYKGPYTHIQSMFFILKNDALKFLNSKDFFNENEINNIKNIWNLVITKEIALSQLLLKNNWNLNSITPYYMNLDYRTLKHNINTTGSDVVYKNAFFGRTLTEEEVVFYKLYRYE